MKKVLFNIFLNTILTGIFIYFNFWALKSGLEETFITIAVIYGFCIVTSNAAFIYLSSKRG